MGQSAVLVCDELTGPVRNLSKMLDLFEIPWQPVSSAAFDRFPESLDQPYCVICPMLLAAQALAHRNLNEGLPELVTRAESVFFFGAEPSTEANGLLRLLGLNPSQPVTLEKGQTTCNVWDKVICGPLNGLQIQVTVSDPQIAIEAPSTEKSFTCFLSTPAGCVFGAVDFHGVRCYLASSPSIIDIESRIETGFFDIAEHFFSAVPCVMYLRHSFTAAMWNPVELGACLIVDDPVLRQQYGFVNFQELANSTSEHDFTCDIALIPWNWNRSQPGVVELFKKNQDRLSVCVHGCDHTALEFAKGDERVFNTQTKVANKRMMTHQGRTGLVHDALMVFPQGAFSPVSLKVLKHNGFVAAVNTEVAPTGYPSETQIADFWKMAILKYGDFPIYTRRYPFHGLHNFAFDALLGKPCLIATHHTDFRGGGYDLLDFIDRLNALKINLKWRTLGGVIHRAYEHRVADGIQHLRMYGNEIVVVNTDSIRERVRVEKAEHDATGVDRIQSGNKRIEWLSEKGFIRFEAALEPGETTLIQVHYKDVYGDAMYERGFQSRMKIAARRYLSEFRDELQARAPRLHKQAEMARRWLRSVRSG